MSDLYLVEGAKLHKDLLVDMKAIPHMKTLKEKETLLPTVRNIKYIMLLPN